MYCNSLISFVTVTIMLLNVDQLCLLHFSSVTFFLKVKFNLFFKKLPAFYYRIDGVIRDTKLIIEIIPRNPYTMVIRDARGVLKKLSNIAKQKPCLIHLLLVFLVNIN